jgi:hypothetical protein
LRPICKKGAALSSKVCLSAWSWGLLRKVIFRKDKKASLQDFKTASMTSQPEFYNMLSIEVKNARKKSIPMFWAMTKYIDAAKTDD